MFNHVITNQDLPLVPYQEVLGGPQLVHVLPSDLIAYQMIFNFLQVCG